MPNNPMLFVGTIERPLVALLGRFRHLRYFRFGWERTLVNRMLDECKIGIEVNPKVVLGKPIIRGTSRYPARGRSGAS